MPPVELHRCLVPVGRVCTKQLQGKQSAPARAVAAGAARRPPRRPRPFPMRIRVAAAPPNAELPSSPRSFVAPAPSLASSAACLLLLATAGDKPLGSLHLSEASPFQVHASSLRLPAEDPAQRDEVASELLWHASREMPALRSGAALLAKPAAEDDADVLRTLGFMPANGEPEPTWALVRRRNATEVLSYSHTALRVSDIKQSLDFWSLLHFAPSRLFTTSGARAAWLSAPWTALAIELIEVPAVVLQQIPPAQRAPSDVSLGPAHLVVDVTSLGVSLPATLELLQERSASAFGRTLHVITPPHQQMIGGLVTEAVVVRAPDGVQLRLTHQAGFVERSMEADWTMAQVER